MKRSVTFAVAIFMAASPALASEDQWIPLRKAIAYMKTLKTQERIVTVFECRESTRPAFYRVEARVVSKPNPSGKQWDAMAYSGMLSYRPDSSDDWRVVYEEFVHGTGEAFRCALFHKR